ncbi:hypothetical protein [Streptomyces sp. GC420]|uniref:hypothetical protein n=1 Tax=Streptomyces sp. GC420 TaxID=2697568 RepID=UPI0028BD1C4C|nr:hypothetical protein [Streptomyces sp. GC420]
MFELPDLRKVLLDQPQLRQMPGIPGEHDLPAGDTPQFPEPSVKIGPMVHGHHRHRRVELAVPEGQVLRTGRHLPSTGVLVQHGL